MGTARSATTPGVGASNVSTTSAPSEEVLVTDICDRRNQVGSPWMTPSLPSDADQCSQNLLEATPRSPSVPRTWWWSWREPRALPNGIARLRRRDRRVADIGGGSSRAATRAPARRRPPRSSPASSPWSTSFPATNPTLCPPVSGRGPARLRPGPGEPDWTDPRRVSGLGAARTWANRSATIVQLTQRRPSSLGDQPASAQHRRVVRQWALADQLLQIAAAGRGVPGGGDERQQLQPDPDRRAP